MWPSDTDILDLAKPFIKARESFRAAPYLDSAGIATLGWGTIRYPSGNAVTMHDAPIDTGFAEACLTSECMKKLDAMRAHLTREPTAHQAAALLSFAYNEGVNALLGSALIRDFDAGDDAGVAAEFPRWSKAHVKGQLVELPGLLKRRNMELALYQTPDISRPALVA